MSEGIVSRGLGWLPTKLCSPSGQKENYLFHSRQPGSTPSLLFNRCVEI